MAARSTGRSVNAHRFAALAHAVSAVVLVALVFAMAYGAAAPHLAVAEFSPSAQQQLQAPPPTDAPGKAGGQARSSRRSTTTTAPIASATSVDDTSAGKSSTTRAARTRSCVGNPPRQTEDPMSPACVAAIFEGDNGGATWNGVTGSEIRIAVPYVSTDPKSIENQALAALFEHFNRRFEFYGRRLVPVAMPGSASDAASSRALASQIAAQGVFGTLTGFMERWSYAKIGMGHELARDGVVAVINNRTTWWSDEGVFDGMHPYIWSVYPSLEQIEQDLASVGCSLANKPASHTDDSDLAGKTRTFGIVASAAQVAPAVRELSDGIEACAGTRPRKIEYLNDTTALRTGLTQLAGAGVTTVFCVCERGTIRESIGYAADAGYRPEWISTPLTATAGDESNIQSLFTSGDPTPIQVNAGPRLVPLQARPWFTTMVEINPKLFENQSSSIPSWQIAEQLYDQLLVMAAGIQGAGPQLTPDHFGQALMTMQFPNPGAGQAPLWQPGVRFGPGDHSFYSDFAIGWWSGTAPAVDPYAQAGRGSWCYVGAGTRFEPSTVPGDLDGLLYNAALPCR